LLEGRRLLSSGPVVPEEGSDIPSPSRTISKGETKMNTTTLTRSTTIEHRHPIGGSVCFDRLGWSPLWRVEGVELEDGEPVYLLSFGREDRPEHEAGRSEASPVRVEFADGQFRALGLFSGDAKGPYETVVEEPVDVEHKFSVGDTVTNRAHGPGAKYKIEAVVLDAYGVARYQMTESLFTNRVGFVDRNFELVAKPVLFPVGTVVKWGDSSSDAVYLVTKVDGNERELLSSFRGSRFTRTVSQLDEFTTTVSKVVK
jgi:hypothetical protein